MAKLNLKDIKNSVGIGEFVEKTIEFRNKDGGTSSGEILVRIPSHAEFSSFTDVFKGVDKKDITVDQSVRAIVFGTIYETEKKKFFSSISETETDTNPEILDAMFSAVDEVADLSGKKRASATKKKSGVSSSPVELAEKQ